MKSQLFILMALVLFWAGFVSSISFMEAWLKFRADGVTLKVGLSIGKKIFTALNRTEWAFLLVYSLLHLRLSGFRREARTLGAVLIFFILFIQTFFILPALNNRVDLILDGQTLEKSAHHIYFGTLEILKVGFLIALALQWHKASLQAASVAGIRNKMTSEPPAGNNTFTDNK